MEVLQLNIEKSRFLGLLQALNVSDKWENTLKKSLLCDRMENLLDTLETDELSMEDITETLEEVRQERYEKDKQYV
jgi:septum formation inhibitor-activating ATPase MinD